jgi:hypothetical protein
VQRARLFDWSAPSGQSAPRAVSGKTGLGELDGLESLAEQRLHREAVQRRHRPQQFSHAVLLGIAR